ncbi:MAG: hypothetical protein OHK0038_10880 [Flammeovirgaceae bacterium]
MELLNESQIEFILRKIQSEGITIASLQTDLLDHFCCMIEERVAQGVEFEKAYWEAYRTISPNGIQEIEEETFLLLTLNKQINMKKLLYAVGFISAFCLSNYVLFRHLKWEGANYFMMVGMLALLFGVIPILGYWVLKSIKLLTSLEKFRIVVGLISGIFISVGMIFKVLHYPGANLSFLIGMILLNILFLPIFFYQLYKRSLA